MAAEIPDGAWRYGPEELACAHERWAAAKGIDMAEAMGLDGFAAPRLRLPKWEVRLARRWTSQYAEAFVPDELPRPIEVKAAQVRPGDIVLFNLETWMSSLDYVLKHQAGSAFAKYGTEMIMRGLGNRYAVRDKSVVLATFRHYGEHDGRVYLSLIHQAVYRKPDDTLHVLRNSAVQRCATDCEAARLGVGDMLRRILGALWRGVDAPLSKGGQAVDPADVESAIEGHAAPTERAFDAALTIAVRLGLIFFKTHGEDEWPYLSTSGQVWHIADRRLEGEELVENARPKEPASTYQVNFDGDVHGSQFSIGTQAQQNVQISNADTRAVIAAVLAIVATHRQNLALAEPHAAELDSATATLAELADDPQPDRGRLGKAMATVAGLAGQLILGAGGNALWESVKALAA